MMPIREDFLLVVLLCLCLVPIEARSSSSSAQTCSPFPPKLTSDDDGNYPGFDDLYKPFQLTEYSLTYRTCMSRVSPRPRCGDSDGGCDDGGGRRRASSSYYGNYYKNDENDNSYKDYYTTMNDDTYYPYSSYGYTTSSPTPSPQSTSAFVTTSYAYFMMCPTSTCPLSTSSTPQNCAVYMLELDDYIETYLKYAEKKKEYFCSYCKPSCSNGWGDKRFCIACQSHCDSSSSSGTSKYSITDYPTCTRIYDKYGYATAYHAGPKCVSSTGKVRLALFTDSECAVMYKTSDVAGLFKSITGGLKLDTDDPMMSLLNSKDCSSCQIGPYQSKSSSSIFSTFHYEYYRQISKKVSFESNQWDPVSALCSNLYSIPAMLRCEQDIPGVTYCSSSELKNNAQICTEMSHAEPLAYEAINNAENNPYGTHERGGYTNRTRYRSWFIVSMSFLVPLTGMLATHAMFLRSRLGWFHREGEGEESDVGFENFERFFERMSVHNNACLRFFRLRRASDDDVLRKNTETYKSAAWDEAASWEEDGPSQEHSLASISGGLQTPEYDPPKPPAGTYT